MYVVRAMDPPLPEPRLPEPRRRRRPLPWPAGRITADELHALWLAGQVEGLTISEIVHRAVLSEIAQIHSSLVKEDLEPK